MKFEETAIERFWNRLRSEVKDANSRVDVLVGVLALEFEFLSEHEPESKEAVNYILRRYNAKCERLRKLNGRAKESV